MYPELPQDMGEIWHHWVRSVWPQKMGSARLAVLWPRLAKVTIDKVKNVFWLKVIFFKTSIQINFIFVVSNGQSDIAAFCRIFRAFWQINSTASWPTVPPPCILDLLLYCRSYSWGDLQVCNWSGIAFNNWWNCKSVLDSYAGYIHNQNKFD